MMRHITLILACLFAGSLISQAQVLVKVKSDRDRLIEAGQTYTLDLGDYFQLFNAPGPVAEFTISMPVQTGVQQLLYQLTDLNEPDYDPEGPTLDFMTYELTAGGTYTHVFDPAATAEDFVFAEHKINFQLLADVAPITVGNFIEYVAEDAYDGVVVHRSEIGVAQMGRYRFSESDDYLLETIPGKGFIQFEETIANAQGTLAMARSQSLNSAQSEFFINLVDNSDQETSLGTRYSVFGEVMNFDTNMPLLEQWGETYVYDLSTLIGAVFGTTPLYSPSYLQEKSWLNVVDVSIPEGDRDGVVYSYEFGDLDGVEGTSDTEAAFQESWDIVINNGILEISRNDSGIALLEVKGTFGDQESTLTIPLTGYEPNALNAFPAAAIQTEGYLSSPWYGRMLAETFPEVIHENHGRQWIYPIYDDLTGGIDYYIWDEGMASWAYTYDGLYPYMYFYNLDKWLGYVLTTGDGEDNPRWFYDFSAQEWIFED